MSEQVEEKGVNSDGIDNRMDDHDAGIGSPADEMETHNPDIDDYDNIIDLANSGDDEEASGETEKTDESEDTKVDESGDGEDGEEEARIPKSRLDEVIAQREALDKELAQERAEYARREAYFEGRLKALEEASKPQDTVPESNPFEQLLQDGEPQEILDALQENPGTFFQNLQAISNKQAQVEMQRQREEEASYNALVQGLDKFAEEHDGFMEKVQDMGAIVDSNPIHNLVSAYAYEVEIPAMKAAHENTVKDLEGKIEAARNEGIKLGKDEALKELKAKGNAAVLDGSQAAQGAKVAGDPELQNTEESGGIRNILVEKLKAMRAQK